MFRSLFSFLRFFIFWIVFSILTRALFELYFSRKLSNVNIGEVLQTFLYGARIDASAAGYICVIPLIVFSLNWFTAYHIKPIWLRLYVYLCVLLISLIAVINLNIFREWGTKVNFRAFDTFFHSPSEALASTSSSPIGLSLFFLFLLLIAGYVLSSFMIDFNFVKPKVPFLFKPVVIILLLGFDVIVIRGGLQLAPISQSMAYFSEKPMLNQSALNTEWNLMHNTLENAENPLNPYIFMPVNKASTLVDSMFSVKKDTSIHILKNNRPNVVIIQLESFTADLIESLGGEKGDAPNFEKLISQGVLFDNIYSAGDRTDKGIVAILSGFPSQATRTIIVDNVKQEHLPALSEVFSGINYRTSYFYGGESEFMNFKAYLLSHKIDNLVDKASFEARDMNSKWGAHDDVVMKKNLDFLNRQQQPFFSYLQTLSNHEPFELPVPPHFPGADLSNKFRSTAFYTDVSLKAYFIAAQKQPWYKNTLFILVADHGHRLPRNTSEVYDPAKYHIPLLFFGDAIKPEYRGKRIDLLGNQTDIAATLLAQMDLPHKQFKWSKDLLNPYTKPFAFFDWDDGFGFMLPQQAISFDAAGNRVNFIKNKSAPAKYNDRALQYGKAFLQEIFTEYMKY